MRFILGRKIGMTRVFDDEGRSFAVTKIAVLPTAVSQVKTKDTDGYKAVQVTSYKDASKKKSVKVTEFKVENPGKYKKDEAILAKQFKKNDSVTVVSTAKGKGFAGTIKRHGFSRGPMTHGSNNHRAPGSIGGGYPQRVVLGRKMAGRMGGGQVSVKNLRIVDLDDEMILIAGSIPGANKTIVKIFGTGEKAEEIIDHTAEEERLAQEKMLEADKEAKEEKTESQTEEVEKPKE